MADAQHDAPPDAPGRPTIARKVSGVHDPHGSGERPPREALGAFMDTGGRFADISAQVSGHVTQLSKYATVIDVGVLVNRHGIWARLHLRVAETDADRDATKRALELWRVTLDKVREMRPVTVRVVQEVRTWSTEAEYRAVRAQEMLEHDR